MKNTLLILGILTSGLLLAQQPTHVPSPQNNTPIDLNNWFDVVVFIIMPVIMVLLYLLWRRQVKMDKKTEEEEENKNNNS